MQSALVLPPNPSPGWPCIVLLATQTMSDRQRCLALHWYPQPRMPHCSSLTARSDNVEMFAAVLH